MLGLLCSKHQLLMVSRSDLISHAQSYHIQDGGFVLGENVGILVSFNPLFFIDMDKPSIQLSTSISPSALDSFSLPSGNQGEISDASLFPYLDQMSELHQTPLTNE